MSVFFSTRIFPLSIVLAALTACVQTAPIHERLVTIQQADQNLIESHQLSAPYSEAIPLFVAAVQSTGFSIHKVESQSQALRILVSRGTTMGSWGEVGRIDLSNSGPDTTNAAITINMLHTEANSAQNWYVVPDWIKNFAKLKSALATNRQANTYRYVKVDRAKGRRKIPHQTDGSGVLIGLIFAGPLGAASASDVEESKSTLEPFLYYVKDKTGPEFPIISFVPAQKGDCVALADKSLAPVKENNPEMPVILISVESAACS